MTPDRSPKTVADLQRITGLGRDTVRAAIQSGSLPGYKVGSRYVIPVDAYEDFCHGRWEPLDKKVIEIRYVPQPASLITRKQAS